MVLLMACSNNNQIADHQDDQDENTGPFTPQEALVQIQRGINIGNTLEPPQEGDWNNGQLQEYYFDDYKAAGFTCVRIPVRWDKHTSKFPPYLIDFIWMNRVEQIVDWGLDRDLFIIINGHHEEWIKEDYSSTNIARYERIWTQISDRFKDKSHKLFFEIINEPFGLTKEQIDDLNSRILPIIRQDNPQRIVIYSGNDYSNLPHLMAAAIPDDDYLMAYYHSYDPWSFAGEGNGTWGTFAEKNAVRAKFQQAAGWSMINNMPVMISEFGAIKDCDYNSRMLHYYTYVESALNNNIAFQVWDDGGNFGIYERDSRTWPEVKDILIYTYPESPTGLSIDIDDNSSIVLSWQNRTSANNAIRVERKTIGSIFITVTQLTANASEYRDVNVNNNVYIYRIITEFNDQPDMYSYPVKVAF